MIGDYAVIDHYPLPDFQSAAQEILVYLQQQLGFDLWMVTRTEANDWIVLQANDRGYGVNQGDVFRWSDSFCAQMIQGKGPRIAPCSQHIAAYASAPIGQQVKIRAYVGVPLVYRDGSLFGTLCAIDPEPQPEQIESALPLVELLANLLSTILHADLKAAEQSRRVERLKAEAWNDALTGLYNRRGWDELMAGEESRCQRYGYPACVISIDLDGLKQVNDSYGHSQGDQLICQAGRAIQQGIRHCDIAARVGGDEFAVLGVNCNLRDGERLLKRIRHTLTMVNVKASLGLAVRQPQQGLLTAWQESDQAMYAAKRAKFFLKV